MEEKEGQGASAEADDIQAESSSTSGVSSAQLEGESLPEQPSDIAEEKRMIKDLISTHKMKEDENWYLISTRWWRKWKSYVQDNYYSSYVQHSGYYSTYYDSYNTRSFGSTDGGKPGPIENQELLEVDPVEPSEMMVRKGLTDTIDFELVCEDVWKLVQHWYGGGPTICRPVVRSQGHAGYSTLFVEVRKFTVSVMKSSDLTGRISVHCSKWKTVGQFKEEMCAKFNLNPEDVRLWDYHGNTKFKLLTSMGLTLEASQIVDGQAMLLEEKGPNGFPEVQRDFRSYYSYHQPLEHGGVCGLQNLGNTCFMNSALQCLSNTVPLTEYFLQGKWRDDVNAKNPLGTGGELAEEYSGLIGELWNGPSNVVVPRDFKWKLERFAPAFAGYQQHDSQELMAYLLDGLHEDLNRIKQKPYVEIPDSSDLPLDVAAKQAWERHLMRNDSVIVDHFQGQLKSTVICPDCSRVSVTFDPFMFLSLPLPMKRTRIQEATVYFLPHSASSLPAACQRKPLKLAVNVPAFGTIRDFKVSLGKATGILPDCLIVCDIYNSRFFNTFAENEPMDVITARDIIHVYEVQSSPPSKEREEEIVRIPLLQRTKEIYSFSSYGQQQSHTRTTLTGVPAVLSVPSNISYNQLCDAVLELLGPLVDREALALWEQEKEDDDECAGTGEAVKTDYYQGQSGTASTSYMQDSDGEPYDTDSETSSEEREEVDDGFVVVDMDPHRGGGDEGPTHDEPGEVAEDMGLKPDGADVEMSEQGEDTGHTTTMSERSGEEARASPEEIPSVTSNAKRWPFKIKPSDGYGQTDRFHPLSMGDGNTPLYLRDQQILCVRWIPKVQKRVYLREKEGEIMIDRSIAEVREEAPQSMTISDCLELFTQTEQLGEDDLWYCPSCKEHKQATKKFDLWKLPDVLIVHLKRFSFKNRYWRDKLETYVDFPLTSLDFGQAVQMIGDSSPVYNLFAVSNHMGSLGGGHYTACARNKKTQKWYRFDDSFVTEVNESNLKSSNAYVLFYRRAGSEEKEETGSTVDSTSASDGVSTATTTTSSSDTSSAMDVEENISGNN